MNVNEIINSISSVGFPIIACIALFWKNNQDDIRHQEEMKTMTKALEDNTLAIQKMNDLLERGAN